MVEITVKALTFREVQQATVGDLTWHAVGDDLASVPTSAGVYVWAVADTDAVVYIGKATSGLRKRLRLEVALKHDEDETGHSRTVNALDAHPHYAACSDPADASTWERSLLQLHLRMTGLVPVINGGAWWNRGEHYDEARAWAETVARPRLNEPTSRPSA
jgi:hypothetical protein